MSAMTEGPWWFALAEGGNYVVGMGDTEIATGVPFVAAARLMTAAPLLLAVARDALRFMGTEPDAWQRALDAIAAATGAES